MAGSRAAATLRGAVARIGLATATGLAAAAAYFAVPSPKDLPGWTQLCLGICGMLLLSAMIARLVLQHFFGPADNEVRIELLLTAILVSVLLFGFAYHTVSASQPGQFTGLRTRLDALYFSLSTVATAGPGGVHPDGQLARALVTGQMIFDMLLVTAALSVVSGRLHARKDRGDIVNAG